MYKTVECDTNVPVLRAAEGPGCVKICWRSPACGHAEAEPFSARPEDGVCIQLMAYVCLQCGRGARMKAPHHQPQQRQLVYVRRRAASQHCGLASLSSQR